MKLSDSIVKLKGVGEKTAALYGKLSVFTIGDLLCHFPKGYERFEAPVLIAALKEGATFTVAGMLTAPAKPVPGNARKMIVARIRDISGEMELRWFNSP